ncbi:MAG: amino-acid N-acetyltransferase [Verrucomicrobiales bacterium]
MKFGDLRGILQYVPQFRGATFVIAVDGPTVALENFSNILLDIAVLHSLSVKIVLVHGASHQINALAREREVAISSSDGIGITDPLTLALAEEAINNLNGHLLQQLTGAGLRGGTGTFLDAHPAGIIRGRDLEFTGTIEKVDIRGLSALLDADMVPVVSPLGYDGQGGVLRLNSDAVALQVAIALKALKILFITSGGLKDDGGERIPALSVEEAKGKAAQLSPERDAAAISSLLNAARACESGVSRVHIINGAVNEVLLEELFSNEGVGTMVYSDDYQKIRPAKLSDIPALMSMIRQSVADEELIPRSPKEIRTNLPDYFVMETDGNPVGCVAVHFYPEQRLAELACLFISNSHEGAGYGRKLVTFAERKAREKGADNLIALSTQAWRYFEQKSGFTDAPKTILPPERLKKHESGGRNSRIMVKAL